MEQVIRATLPAELLDENTKYYINPTGRFVVGGPQGDSGLTGRKIIVDTYGGAARHGGGAFSGKDPSKVDRSAAYAARWVAKNIVAAGLARRCEVQLAYAIGVAEPVSIMVDTFGTGTVADEKLEAAVEKVFDLRPAAIIRDLDLRKPIYRPLAAYGHMGPARTSASSGKPPTAPKPSRLRRCKNRQKYASGGPHPHPGARAAVLQQGGKRGIIVHERIVRERLCQNWKRGNCMTIRRAAAKDMPRIQELLWQVELVHHAIRPDLFKNGGRKYTDEELAAILADDTRPVLAAVDENDRLLGYAFCMLEECHGSNIMNDRKNAVHRRPLRRRDAARAAHRPRAVRGGQGLRPRPRLPGPDLNVGPATKRPALLRILRLQTPQDLHGLRAVKAKKPRRADF